MHILHSASTIDKAPNVFYLCLHTVLRVSTVPSHQMKNISRMIHRILHRMFMLSETPLTPDSHCKRAARTAQSNTEARLFLSVDNSLFSSGRGVRTRGLHCTHMDNFAMKNLFYKIHIQIYTHTNYNWNPMQPFPMHQPFPSAGWQSSA